MSDWKIAIAGAGSIGLYVGGLLAHAGHDVRFLARPRIVEAVEKDGLRLTDYDGLSLHLSDLTLSDDPGVLAGADFVLVTVKSSATAEMGALIAQHAPAGAIVISLQNGVTNADVLRAALPGRDVRAAMVSFNVLPKGPAVYHRGTSGDILVEAGPLPDLSSPHLGWQSTDNITGVQWGKLLINLNNAINALSGLTLLEQLNNRNWRRLMADQMAEALIILRAAGIKPVGTTSAPPGLVPHILRLPTPLFARIAAQMLTIDAQARSSMWDDLTQRRPTEIDALQGEILRLAEAQGRRAPLNTRMRDLIRAAEAAGNGPPGLTVADIRAT